MTFPAANLAPSALFALCRLPTLSLDPSRIARVLGAITVLLVLAHLGGQFSKLELGHGNLKGLVPLFNLSAEENVPAYFSVLLLLFAALLLAVITALEHQRQMPHIPKWGLLTAGFLYMAFDEAFSVHERLMAPLREMMGVADPVGTVKGEVVLGIFYFAWVIPGIAVVLVLGLYFMRFLLHLPASTRYRFLAAATIYLGGALGCELIGGRYAEVHGYDNWTYTFIATAEETLEMAGMITFIWALLKYCAENYRYARVTFLTHERRVATARASAKIAEPRVTTPPA